jgi:NTE family protein
MRALVLSGGGSLGAFTGGMLEYMKLVKGHEYDLYVATSTGTLIQPLASINDFDTLKEAYTNITIDDIYRISPFKKGKKAEETDINIFNALRMHFIEKEPTLGDSTNLKHTLKKFFPEDKFIKSKELNKKIIACVTNLTKIQTEYFASSDLTYEEFCDWTWISCNAVPFTSLVRRGPENDYYADGGFMEHMPICKAIEEGATEIDAFSTLPENYTPEPMDIGTNPLSVISRIIKVLLRETAQRDIDKARVMAKERDVILNIYHVPRKLTNNSLFFDKEQMSAWWDEGYEYMRDAHCEDKKICKTIMLRKKGSKK